MSFIEYKTLQKYTAYPKMGKKIQMDVLYDAVVDPLIYSWDILLKEKQKDNIHLVRFEVHFTTLDIRCAVHLPLFVFERFMMSFFKESQAESVPFAKPYLDAFILLFETFFLKEFGLSAKVVASSGQQNSAPQKTLHSFLKIEFSSFVFSYFVLIEIPSSQKEEMFAKANQMCQFFLRIGFDSVASSSASSSCLMHKAFPFPIEVGDVSLSRQELESLCIGDILIFDVTPLTPRSKYVDKGSVRLGTKPIMVAVQGDRCKIL